MPVRQLHREFSNCFPKQAFSNVPSHRYSKRSIPDEIQDSHIILHDLCVLPFQLPIKTRITPPIKPNHIAVPAITAPHFKALIGFMYIKKVFKVYKNFGWLQFFCG